MNFLLSFLPPPVQLILKSKWFWRVAGVALILFVSWWLYDNYRDMQDEVAQLKIQNQTLVEQVATLEKAKTTLEAADKIQTAAVNKLAEATNQNRTALDKLTGQFNEHDIGYLASKKPVLIERIIDKASNERMRCIEIAAGSKVQPSDKGNDVCPQLVK